MTARPEVQRQRVDLRPMSHQGAALRGADAAHGAVADEAQRHSWW